MPYQLHLQYRASSRNIAKSFTLKQWNAIIQPVLSNYDAEMFFESKAGGIRSYHIHTNQSNMRKLRQELHAAYRRLTINPAFGLHVYGPLGR